MSDTTSDTGPVSFTGGGNANPVPEDHPDRAILEANADLQRQLGHLETHYYRKSIDSPRALENATDVPAQLLVSLKATTVAGLATRAQWLAGARTQSEAIDHYTRRAADIDVDFDDRMYSALMRDLLKGATT